MPSLHPKLHHQIPPWVKPGSMFFVTICRSRSTRPPLNTVANVARGLLGAAAAYHGKRWWCRLWLIMPDHVHGLVSVPAHEQLAQVVGDWKRYTARQAGVTWQDNFFDHRLRDQESLEEEAQYIRLNPVRAGLVSESPRWPWQWQPDESVSLPDA